MEQAEMDSRETDLINGELTEHVIGIFYAVYNELGPGFLESVYVNALVIALDEVGFKVETEVPLAVHFRNRVVGQFRADMLVDDTLIIEVKAAQQLARAHEVQLVNYLRATGIQVGLLLNFGPRAEIRRRICKSIA